MIITAYAFPVLYDTNLTGLTRVPRNDQHGIFVIEFEDSGEHGVRGFLFNRDFNLQGYAPQILNPADYDANSWAMCEVRMTEAGLIYNEGFIHVRVKPLPLNSIIGKVIRHEFHDIPLKTIKDIPL